MIDFLKLTMSYSRAYIFLFVAFAAVLFVELSLSGFDPDRFYNFIENIAFSSVLYTILSTLVGPHKNISLKIFYLLIFFVTLLEGLYFITFNAEISSSSLFIALDSNSNEIGEFLNFNFKYQQALFLFLSVLIFFFSWKFFYIKNNFFRFNKQYFFQVAVIVLGVLLLSKGKINQYNFPYVLTKSIYEYSQQRILIDRLDAKKTPFEDVVLKPSFDNQTQIVVIGESTSRLHFGLYGYQRQTTPKLNEIADELFIFNDVISSETYTVGSLVKALVVKEKDEYVGNVLQLFNQAGYKTFWLSNQPPIGVYETLVTKIALSADITRFMTTESPENKMNYDAVLLGELNKVLLDSSSNKVIFIHLMGTHAEYAYRYPKSFDVFSTKSTGAKQQTIDQYDNAILYNDYILREIIELTRSIDMPASVIYFSDHGEEVYDSVDFAGHTANGILTKNLIEVPFLFWNNANKKFPQHYLDRPFVLDYLSHSLADLYGIQAKAIDTTKSVFHNSFEVRERLVRGSIIVD